ncbi:DUF819 family protein [Phenylobacterium sp.]|uniref:DUF819 family protein n=1 Tax=Phenylobacterium sp. TaxID=1871053 RepID=UPI0025DBEF89|nr:DUF819 family protein [Phenylobacterium sp.]
MALIEGPLAILAVLLAAVAAAEALARLRWGRSIGAANFVILIGAGLANLRIIPPAGGGGPAYDPIFAVVTPAAIFLILLEANLRAIRRAGGMMLAMFLIGAGGVTLGVVIASQVTPIRSLLGADFPSLAGMYAGTYIGGSANFNAVALDTGVIRETGVYAAAVVVDNVMTTIWMLATLAMPAALLATGRFGAPAARRARDVAPHSPSGPAITGVLGLAIPAAMAVTAVAVSDAASEALGHLGLAIPGALIVTTLALIVAQIPGVDRLVEAKPLSLFAAFLFLAVVGASADVSALVQAGRLGLTLLAFVAVLIAVHGVVIVAAGWLLRADPAVMAVASNANIGGGTTSFALAEGLGRDDLVLPGILMGSLGSALGSYVGFATVAVLSGG